MPRPPARTRGQCSPQPWMWPGSAPAPRSASTCCAPFYTRQLAPLLVERGDLDELRARADAGDGPAAERLRPAGRTAD